MTLKKSIIISIFMLGIFLSHTVFAADQPQDVVDKKLADILTQIQNILQDNISNQISQQTNALKNMNVSINAGLTGESNIGAKVNTTAEQTFSNWTPSAQDLANMVETGLQTGSLADQIQYYNEKFGVPSQQNTPKPDKTKKNILLDYNTFSSTSTNAALSVADKGFDNASLIAAQINYLYRQIDQQQTLKEAADLNSVILLKIASLQADLIRLQSQQLKMQSVAQQKNNSEYKFMTNFVQNIQ